MACFQVNLDKVVSECAILVNDAVRDKQGGGGNNHNCRMCVWIVYT